MVVALLEVLLLYAVSLFHERSVSDYVAFLTAKAGTLIGTSSLHSG